MTQLHGAMHAVDHHAHVVLLPLCLAILLVHEHFRSAADGRAFRVGHVLARLGTVVAAVLAYSPLCGLITHVAGAGSGWMTSTGYLDLHDVGAESLGAAWERLGGLSDMPRFVGIVIVWMLLMISVLFAYVAGALLSVVQAVSLSIFLGLGKTCIVVSLIPGVGLAKSWARSLAQVAAWSTVAGIITGLLQPRNVAIGQLIVAGQFVELLKASAHFVVLALTTLAVPLITAKLFAGGAAGLSEVLPGFLAVRGLATGFSHRLNGMRAVEQASGGGPSGGSAVGGGAQRIHKVPYPKGGSASPAPKTSVGRLVRGVEDRSRALFRRLPITPETARSIHAEPTRILKRPEALRPAPKPEEHDTARTTLVDPEIEITGGTES
jgi:hypothetical protein